MVLSLFIGKLVYISLTGALFYRFSINIPRSDGSPPLHGLVCFTRSGFYVTSSYTFGNTLQREMDGSNAYYNSSVLMRSGFHVTDSYIFVTLYRVRWMTTNKKHFRRDLPVYDDTLLSIAKGRIIVQYCNHRKSAY
jgi:hypothetical protein